MQGTTFEQPLCMAKPPHKIAVMGGDQNGGAQFVEFLNR